MHLLSLESILEFQLFQLKQGWDIRRNTELCVGVVLAMQSTCQLELILVFVWALDNHKKYRHKEVKNIWRSSKVGCFEFHGLPPVIVLISSKGRSSKTKLHFSTRIQCLLQNLELCWKSNNLKRVSHDFGNLVERTGLKGRHSIILLL